MRSTDRLLTTHTGSLPRPPELGQPDSADYSETLSATVHAVVRRQVEAGVDIVSDGEMSKPSYATYIADRADGFGGEAKRSISPPADAIDFPEWASALAAAVGEVAPLRPACNAEVRRRDDAPLRRDIANLKLAAQAAGAHRTFMTAASPGVIALFLENQYYPSRDAYLAALVELMREEYNTIHEAGLVLQLDCPDLASSRHLASLNADRDEWKAVIEANVEAVNAATADIPPEAMRLHLCWGNYEGPHTHDVPLREIIDIVLRARPAMLSFEAANPRHGHEWTVFENIELPDGKVLIPGVIDSTTNYVEHPELVAQRLLRFAKLVGREQVIGGTDCGFATFANVVPVFPTVAYAKLAALAEGAARASDKLW
jgi:5-methyltetrahydropteroyltriglutamate--homocysteine methyltransferase